MRNPRPRLSRPRLSRRRLSRRRLSTPSGVLVALLLATGPAWAQSIEGAAGPTHGSVVGDGARAELTTGRVAWKRAPLLGADVVLDALDHEALVDEDAERRVGADWKRSHRIGVVRTLAPVTSPTALLGHPKTELDADGRLVWRMQVESPGAHALRLRLRECDLPAGAELVVYDAYEPDEAYGPIVARDGQVAVWTPSVFSDRVLLEVRAPLGVGELSVTVDAVAHTYRDLGELMGLLPTDDPTSTTRAFKNLSCMNEIASDADWEADIGRAVAAFGLVTDSEQVFCTGSLLNDLDETTLIPWFLTANHCLSSARDARDIEVFWDFRTRRVGGNVPRLRDLPRTVGAELAATHRSTDLTLLRLTGTVPADRFYAGWTFDRPTRGESVVGVHHPEGSHMRISYGRYEGVDPTDSGLHEVSWDDGVTAPGSSGSPLYNASKQVIGQLCCGGSSCNTPGRPDFYGRFDRNLDRLTPFLLTEGDGGGGGGPTPEPPAAAAPEAPVRAKGRGKRGRLVLRWADVADDETEYQVERRTGSSWTPVATLPPNSRRHKLAAEPGLHVFRVGARNAAGISWTVVPAFVRGRGVRKQDAFDPVDDDASGAASVSGGTTGVRVLGRRDRSDWFRVQLQSGTTYRFQSDGDLDTVGAVYADPTVAPLVENDDDERRDERDFGLSFTPTRSGDHWIEVTPWRRRSRGLYVLRWATE